MKTPPAARRRGLVRASMAMALIGSTAVTASAAAAPDQPAPADTDQQATSTDAEPQAFDVERIAGPERYSTAAEIARAIPGPTDTVVVATGADFPDALTSQAGEAGLDAAAEFAPTAEAVGLPVPKLLTQKHSIPSATTSALTDLAPSTIVVVGGHAVVSSEVEVELGAYADQVVRIAGENRYETSALLASGYPTGLPVLYVATGTEFPDALAAGVRAGRDGTPVLLTHPERLPAATATAIEALAPQSVVVLGGDGAISDDTVAAISALVPDTSRLAGADRYETAALIAGSYEFDTDAYVATGENFPDALTGGSLAAHHAAPLVLARATSVPSVTYGVLDVLSPQVITLLGGEAALGEPVAQTLRDSVPLWFDERITQLLSINDYHGHIEEEDGLLTEEQDPEQHLVGGAVNLATTLETLRTRSYDEQTLTVAAGDLIGGSTFISGLFQDEPSVETLDIAGLDISSVGNHEFDEGVEELLRMQHGGNHPELGQFGDEPYAGAGFQWLAANVVDKESGEPILPATEVRDIDGVKVGFIGMTLEETPSLVSPAGVATVDFLDEVETANAQAAVLQGQGVEAIVVLIHEGGYQTGTYYGCEGISGPIVEIAESLDPAIDQVVTGHTHQPYICDIPDPAGDSRLVTSANQYARVVTESALSVSRATGDVLRERTYADNHLVLQSVPDHVEMAEAVATWQARAAVLAGRVVGTVAEDITGDAGGDRGIETPMANLVSDAILASTEAPEAGGAQISFMNVGGVRASLLVDAISNDEEPGEITYEEAYNVMPFGNLIVSIDMTGAQIKATLEQQYVPERGRQYLAMGVSEGFTYTWDDTQAQGAKVSEMELDGVPLEMDTTYRVSTLNFLQQGGDMFTGFTEGTNLLGGPEDLAALVSYFEANPGLTAPGDRINGL